MTIFEFNDTLNITVDDEFEKYNEIRVWASKNAIQCRDKFKQELKNPFLFKDVEDLLKKSRERYEGYVNEVASLAAELFVEDGIMSVDERVFLKKYRAEVTNFDECWDEINDLYNDIIARKKNMDNIAQLRKASRSKWVARGGFGLSGVAKNMMKASMLNAGGKFVHGIGDQVAASNSNAEISSMKKELYAEGYELLESCVFESIASLTFCIIKELNSRGKLELPKLDEDSAEALFHNAQNHLEDAGARLSAYFESIRMDPYNPDVYVAIIQEAPNYNITALDAAEFFGLEDAPAILAEREALLVEGVAFPSRDEADDARLKLAETKNMIENIMTAPWEDIVAYDIALMQFNNDYQGEPRTVLDRNYNNFRTAKDERDRRDRTFRGHLYETLEARDEAERVYEQRRLSQSADVEKELEERLKDIDLNKLNKTTFTSCCEMRYYILQKYDFDTLTDGEWAQKLDGYIKRYKTRRNIIRVCIVFGIIVVIIVIANIL
jgi:hypothetical protein